VSRSGYSDDYADDQWALIRWRGAVASAIRGKRGQALLRDLLAALDAMPEKRLIAAYFVREDGCACALGVLGRARGIDVAALNPRDLDDGADRAQVAKAFGVSEPLAAEIMFVNDEGLYARTSLTDEQRWRDVREWVASQIVGEKP
jgi:hypothetical protein